MPASEQNRPAQAKGIGKNSKRHDLERRTTPYLHDSDLQQGDVQAMEQGQRIAPKQTQQPAQPQAPAPSGQPQQQSTGGGFAPPDPIEFIAGQAGGSLNEPAVSQPRNTKFETWEPIIRQMVAGPGSSGQLFSAYVNQLRGVRRQGSPRPAIVIDMNNIDDGIEAMLTQLESTQEVTPDEEVIANDIGA